MLSILNLILEGSMLISIFYLLRYLCEFFNVIDSLKEFLCVFGFSKFIIKIYVNVFKSELYIY